MKLLNLYAHNFKKLKLKQPLVFTEGIILVTGLNESGKSTILDAILYALFGRMIRPSQKPGNEEIISYGASDCQVKLDFEIGQNKYRVIREVHKTRAGRALLQEIRPDNTTRNIASTVNDTTEEVERLLGGITYNEIVASSVVAQKDLERLIKQRLDDRRKVINVFLNLESFNKVQDELEGERNAIEGTPRNPGKLAFEKKQLERLQDQLKQFNEEKEQLSSLEDKSRKWKTDLSTYEIRLDETERLYKVLNDYGETLKSKQSLEVEVRDKNRLLQNLNQQLEQAEANRKILGEAKEKSEEYDGLEHVDEELVTIRSQLGTISGLRSEERQLLTNIQNKERSIAAKRLEQESKPVVEQSVSPTQTANHWTYLILTAASGAGSLLSFLLGQIWLTVGLGSLAVVFLLLHARQIALISTRQSTPSQEALDLATNAELVKVMEGDLSRLKAELWSTQEKASDLSRETLVTLKGVTRYSPLIPNASVDIENAFNTVQTAFEKDLQEKRDLQNKIEMLTTFIGTSGTVKSRLNAVEKELAVVNEKLSGLKIPEIPSGIIFSSEVLDKTTGDRDELRDTVSGLKVKIEEAISRQREIRKHLEENKDVEEKTRQQEETISRLQRDLDVVKYGLKGIEQTSETLRNRVRPQVERYMGLILPVITSGRYKAVQLDDNYTVRVFDPDAGEFKPREVFSGGTEDQMLLAMRLAFALALMPPAKGRNPEFLFLDEPLGSSDKIRRDGILMLLRKELSQNFKQIFLVSHVGDLEAEANSIIQMDNGYVQEQINRQQAKNQQAEEIEIPA